MTRERGKSWHATHHWQFELENGRIRIKRKNLVDEEEEGLDVRKKEMRNR
jgi:hypothetical protein